MNNKKAGRSNGVVRETAEFHVDKKKFNEGYDRVYGEKDKVETPDEKVDTDFYYLNKLFPSDRAKVNRIDDGIVHFTVMANGMENKSDEKTFLRYWKISKMKVE